MRSASLVGAALFAHERLTTGKAGMSRQVIASVLQRVAARLADPAQVARSRQFPYRFLSAHLNAPSQRWGHALDKALSASTANIPAFRMVPLLEAGRNADWPWVTA